MKILHIVSYYPPDRICGVGEVVYHLHHRLRDQIDIILLVVECLINAR